MNTKCFLLTAALLSAVTYKGATQPIITKQPTNQSVSLGASVKFLVSATTTNAPILYQWRFATTNLSAVTNASLTLTNIQITNAGDYDALLTDGSGSVTSHVAHLEVDPTFTKITTGSIVTDVGTGTACAWGDYDNDGFIDLYVTSAHDPFSSSAKKSVLYHNNRDGTFSKVTNTVTTSIAQDWRGCSWVDYDNDGNLDLIAVTVEEDGFPGGNYLFHNNGDGSFTAMTATNTPGVFVHGIHSEGPVWADYNRDGFVDLFIAKYGMDWFYRNNGDGTFTQMTNAAVGLVADNRDSYNAMWCDYDNDGWPDLFVAVKDPNGLNQTNFFYHNQGNGTFSRVLSGSIGTNNHYSIACIWGDYDNDGHPDLFVTSGVTRTGTNVLYHNNGDGTFTRMSSAVVGSLVSDVSWFTQAAWGDYDNDGFLDLFVSQDNSLTYPNPIQSNFLYHNNGDGTFTRIFSGSLVNEVSFSYGCSWGDYDNDGFLDLFVAGGADNAPESNLLYRNNGNSNAFIKVKLIGTASNRSAIGAKVRVHATIRGNPMWQLREVNTGDGYCANQLDPHFGLGDATNIDTVRIEWPSGIVQTLTNVAPKQFLTVVEHQQPGATNAPSFTSVSSAPNGSVNLSVSGDAGLLYVLEASTNLANWTKLAVRSNATGVVDFNDPKAANYAARFYRVSIP